MNKIVKDSFIAVSDFHSYKWPLDKIKKYYLNEYDKIFILGDATDRGPKKDGTGGVELLLEIKELCEKYPNRVFYIPGNHDEFLYGHYKDKKRANKLFGLNGGLGTLKELNDLKRYNPSKYEDLFKWLGSQPLQRTHEFKGQKFAFAHALFDAKIYNKVKDLSFDKLYKIQSMLSDREIEELEKMLWFRKDESDYDSRNLPSNDFIMVIGHTPEKYRRGMNLDLVNAKGQTIKVVCVDGGIAYNGTMLKFDGMFADAVGTEEAYHEDTSPKPRPIENKQNKQTKQNKLKEEQLEMETLTLDCIISEALKNNCSIYEITNAILYGNVDGLPDNARIRTQSRRIAENSINELITKIAIENINYVERNRNCEVILHNYIIETALRIIFSSLKEYYTSIGEKEPIKRTSNQLDGFLTENDPAYITRKAGNSRNIAKIIGSDSFKKIIRLNKCSNINEYINKIIQVKQNY